MTTARLLMGLSLALAACGGSSASTPTTAETAQPSGPSGPVIAALKTHDGKVAIVGGGKDLRIVVTKDDGTVVADNVTLDELRTKDPESFAIVKSAVASKGTYLDATFVAEPAPVLK